VSEYFYFLTHSLNFETYSGNIMKIEKGVKSFYTLILSLIVQVLILTCV